jgi:hypothetical protein
MCEEESGPNNGSVHAMPVLLFTLKIAHYTIIVTYYTV